MWTRPDTGDAPVSYPAPTYSAVKGIFESILMLKNAEVVPTRIEICSPVMYHTYTTNYGGPLRKQQVIRKGAGYQLIATVLINVCYKLFARVDRYDPDFKKTGHDPPLESRANGAHAYKDIFERRLIRGQCHSIPFLGWKEFAPDYVGPLRPFTWKLDDINLEIPIMLKMSFSERQSPEWRPVFSQNVVINEGVLHYDQ